MTVHSGKDAVIKVGTETVGKVRSYTLKEAGNTIDASSIGNDWKEYLPGQLSWSGTIECLYDPADQAQEALMTGLEAGTECSIVFFPIGNVAGNPSRTGNALITDVSDSVATDEGIGCSISFQGTGALVRGTVSAP